MNNITIYYPKPSKIHFAVRELSRCLKKMTGVTISIRPCARFPYNKPAIYIGEPSQLGEPIKSNALDDEILVTQHDNICIITGSNPRSVLFAVYAVLEKLGARWAGPGKDGEYLPDANIEDIFNIDIHERASYRHRGICIEGAPSVNHTLDMIDWMAKKRMNTFFLQFKTSIFFWQKWYNRAYNDRYLKPRTINETTSLEMDDLVIKSLKKRGFILQQVGHGWTAESIGLKGLGWYRFDGDITPQQKALMAEVNGERGLFGGIPINTELCYSNQEAYKNLVNHVIDYAINHPEVDSLHFWLSDAPNNWCECTECRKLSQSDHYVKMVKSVSRKLKEKGIPTRIIFLCYTNTLSAPIVEKIENVDNVIFMYAPVSRCYQHTLTDDNCESGVKVDEWKLNRIQPPRTNKEFVEILRKWQERYTGDSFLFDYYLWRPFHDFLNTQGLARIIYQDMKNLKKLGLNGLISCQILRCFYPAGIIMDVIADTLWNRNVKFADIVSSHLKTAFGAKANTMQKYFDELEKALNPESGHIGTLRSDNEWRISGLLALLDKWESYITSLSDDAQNIIENRNAYNLKHYHKLLRMRAMSALYDAKGDKELAKLQIDKIVEYLKKTERRMHRHFDTWMELHTIGRA